MRSLFFTISFGAWGSSLLLSVLLLGFSLAGAAEFKMPIDRQSVPALRPAQRVLLQVTRAGERLVAVGERGLILLSEDGGDNWRQATTPVSVTLTAVDFPTPKEGWAAGHGGVVLHTEDGGDTWIRQLDGRAAAQIELESAEAAAKQPGHLEDTQAERRLANAKFLVKEGADKPFFDVLFLNETTGFVVGAFGFLFGTQDGGKTWESWMDRIDNPKELHFFSMEGGERNLWIAGEKGFLACSTDSGKTFTRINSPSVASYFALNVSASGKIVLGGLQGNAYRSEDQGKTFQKIEIPQSTSVNAIAEIDGNVLIFATQSGQLFSSWDGGCSLQPVTAPPTERLASVTQGPNGILVAVGINGVTRVSKPQGESSPDNKEATK